MEASSPSSWSSQSSVVSKIKIETSDQLCVFLEILYHFIIKTPQIQSTILAKDIIPALIGYFENYAELMNERVQKILIDIVIDLDNDSLVKQFLKYFFLNIDITSKTSQSFKLFISQTTTTIYQKKPWMAEVLPVDWILKSVILYFYSLENKVTEKVETILPRKQKRSAKVKNPNPQKADEVAEHSEPKVEDPTKITVQENDQPEKAPAETQETVQTDGIEPAKADIVPEVTPLTFSRSTDTQESQGGLELSEEETSPRVGVAKEDAAGISEVQGKIQKEVFMGANIDYMVNIIESLLQNNSLQVTLLQKNTNFIFSSLCFPNLPYRLQRYLLSTCEIVIKQLLLIEQKAAKEIVNKSNIVFSLIDFFKSTKCYVCKATIMSLFEKLVTITSIGLKSVIEFLSIFVSNKICSPEEYPGTDIEDDLNLFFNQIFQFMMSNNKICSTDLKDFGGQPCPQEDLKLSNPGLIVCLLKIYDHLNFSSKAVLLSNLKQLISFSTSNLVEFYQK
jgi:hypothetical protein